MGLVIKHINQVTPEWLTGVLKHSGDLDRGKVKEYSYKQSHLEGFTSERYHLRLVYTENTPNQPFDCLFLKIGKPEFFENCKKEIDYLRSAKQFQTKLPLIKYYDSSYSTESRHSHLLLQDLSRTHFSPDFTEFRRNPNAPWPLSRMECEAAIECLASVHASWWKDSRLGNEIGELPSRESSDQYFKYVEESMISIFDVLGVRLSSESQSIYESALSSYPGLYWKYIDSGAPLTIIHAEPHLGNFMFPIDKEKDKTLLLDWQTWRVEISMEDPALMMALNWHPNQRQVMERELLLHYHRQLQKGGVENYSWDECWFGYRMAVIWMLFTPILWYSQKLPLDHCWSFMEKSYAAFQDLKCIELLEED